MKTVLNPLLQTPFLTSDLIAGKPKGRRGPPGRKATWRRQQEGANLRGQDIMTTRHPVQVLWIRVREFAAATAGTRDLLPA